MSSSEMGPMLRIRMLVLTTVGVPGIHQGSYYKIAIILYLQRIHRYLLTYEIGIIIGRHISWESFMDKLAVMLIERKTHQSISRIDRCQVLKISNSDGRGVESLWRLDALDLLGGLSVSQMSHKSELLATRGSAFLR